MKRTIRQLTTASDRKCKENQGEDRHSLNAQKTQSMIVQHIAQIDMLFFCQPATAILGKGMAP
jgi:hypothetical protein